MNIHRSTLAHRKTWKRAKWMLPLIFCVLALVLSACQAEPKNKGTVSPLAANAPVDEPKGFYNETEYDSLIAPSVRQALSTLPESKKRYLNGLPAGEVFFVSTKLRDPDGNGETVFVEVKQWNEDQIQGIIANELNNLKTYEFQQKITLAEADVIDWTISKPDGSEEGNFVGKFIETLER